MYRVGARIVNPPKPKKWRPEFASADFMARLRALGERPAILECALPGQEEAVGEVETWIDAEPPIQLPVGWRG